MNDRDSDDIFGPAAIRGVYPADRAAALAGVPRSTVYYWARKMVLPPSVSIEKLKLWSWADLVALRAVYWLRHPLPREGRRPTPMKLVRSLIDEMEGQIGNLGHAISSNSITLLVDQGGVPYIQAGGGMVEGRHAWRQGVASDLVIDLLSPFGAEVGIRGPHLLNPRPSLRIIPGKLSGEPHVEDTRIESRVLWVLHNRGYSPREISDLYGGIAQRSVNESIDLEQQLQSNINAA